MPRRSLTEAALPLPGNVDRAREFRCDVVGSRCLYAVTECRRIVAVVAADTQLPDSIQDMVSVSTPLSVYLRVWDWEIAGRRAVGSGTRCWSARIRIKFYPPGKAF